MQTASDTALAPPDWDALTRLSHRCALGAIAFLAAASFFYCYGYALLAGTGVTALQSLGWTLADWAVWAALAPLIGHYTLRQQAAGLTRRQALARTLRHVALALAVLPLTKEDLA